jgi:tellurite resistance protein
MLFDMNISRDNYEEYFLLYADNELTDSEKAEVLMFIKDNKDLEEEFRMIHYTISKPDKNIELTDKTFLLKNDAMTFINEENYEEIFVLYQDNELNAEEKSNTEEFLTAHPKLKDEFELIGLARFSNEEAIIFPGKKLLYKKEKTGKVIPAFVWRIAAAAIFLGFGLWLSYTYLQAPVKTIANHTGSTNVKPATPVTNKINQAEQKIPDVIAENTSPANEGGINEQHEKKTQQKNQSQNSLASVNGKTSNRNSDDLSTRHVELVKPIPQKSNDEIAVADKEIKDVSEERIIAQNTVEPSNELLKGAIQVIKANPKTYAQTASYEPQSTPSTDNYVFYDVPSNEFKKTKLGGFLKQVRRVIERNSPVGRLLAGNGKDLSSN